MKYNLGKHVLFFILLFTGLLAEDFTYHVGISKQNAYLHEPMRLTVDINQTNPDVILLFDFKIKQSTEYKTHQLFIKNHDTLHHNRQHVIYEIYPLKIGDISIQFSFTKRVTDDDKVSYFASGDRDDFKKLETKDYPINIPDIPLHIKALPKGTQLVGDFTLDYTIKTHQAKAYEALPLQVTLQGKGYPPLLARLLPKDVNFTLFTEQPIIHSTINIQGTHSIVTYPMALSHNKNFTLPTVALKAFNPKTQKSYILTLPAQDFQVTQVDMATLVDKVDYPPLLKTDWSWVQTLLGYLAVFGAGYLSAYALRWKKKTSKKIQKPLIEKIQNTKDTKTLLQLLMAQDSDRFAPCIRYLEKALYDDGKMNLSKIKEEAIDLV